MVNLIRMKLVNFIGPYSGMGIKEFEIDRSKSKNNIILLVGNNGSGKTSIISEMTPLPLEHLGPRTRSRILPDEIGIKELDYLVDGFALYKIKIVYDAKKTTKCFITKVIDNKEIELNPNGNVESYLECINNELRMDKIYTNIGYLSADIKNFVGMKPAERNNYISEWMPEISEFLDAYKISSKILTKLKREIDTYNREIGNMSSVNYELELNFINSNMTNLNKDLEDITKNITELNVYQEQLLPYVKTNQELENLKLKWNKFRLDLYKCMDKLSFKYSSLSDINVNNKEEIDTKIDFHIRNIEKMKYELNQIEETVSLLQSEISSSKNILSPDDKISNTDLNMLIENIEENRNLLNEMKETKLETESRYSEFSPEELIADENTLNKIPFILEVLESKFIQLNNLVSLDYIKDMDNLERLINNSETDKENIIKLINGITTDLSKINNEIYKYEHGNIDTEILMKRPEFCKTETCGIVNELLKYLNPKESLNEMYSKSNELQKQLIDFSASKAEIDEGILNVRKSYGIYVEIVDYMHKNDHIMAKLPLPLFTFVAKEPVAIYVGLNEIKSILGDLTEYNSIVNKIEETSKIINDMNNLKNMVVANSQIQEKLNNSIIKYDMFSARKIEVINELNRSQNKLDLYTNAFERISERDSDINKYNTIIEELEDKRKDLLNVNRISYIYNSNRIQMDKLVSKKLVLQNEIIELTTKRDEMTTFYISKRQIEKLRNELQEEFNKVNILNKIWSPKIGYPSLRIESFLNNLTIQTNADLSKMWGSSIRIEQFKIDASNFSIIVNNNGNIVDDASLLSKGQTSILTTAISFSMIQMNIDKSGYDVLRLDEIDGCLDEDRRQGFISMIQNRLEDIGCDTCAIITHNDEFEDIPCDVILLKGAKIPEEKLINKNILFRY